VTVYYLVLYKCIAEIPVLEQFYQSGRVAQWLACAIVYHAVAGSIPATESSFFLALWSNLRVMRDSRSPIERVGLVVVWLQCLHVARGS